jgi:hypothetical protein
VISKSGKLNYMVPDYLCVPGLDQAVTASEYAALKGLDEEDVLATSRRDIIRSTSFRGKLWVEAPPFCEERLSQLRGAFR